MGPSRTLEGEIKAVGGQFVFASDLYVLSSAKEQTKVPALGFYLQRRPTRKKVSYSHKISRSEFPASSARGTAPKAV